MGPFSHPWLFILVSLWTLLTWWPCTISLSPLGMHPWLSLNSSTHVTVLSVALQHIATCHASHSCMTPPHASVTFCQYLKCRPHFFALIGVHSWEITIRLHSAVPVSIRTMLSLTVRGQSSSEAENSVFCRQGWLRFKTNSLLVGDSH